MKKTIDLSFIDSIFQRNIDAAQEQVLLAEKEQSESSHIFFRGAIKALERTREDIKIFIKEANKLGGVNYES